MDLVSNRVLIFGAKSFTPAKHLKFPSSHQSSGFASPIRLKQSHHFQHRGDILREHKKVLPDNSSFINLAGLSFVADSNSLGFYSVNTIGAINILDILVKNGITPKKHYIWLVVLRSMEIKIELYNMSPYIQSL